MNCENVKEQFSGYLEGSLDYSTNLTVRDHVSQCAKCKSDLGLLRGIWGTLDSLPDIEPSVNLRHDVVMQMARIQHEQKQRSGLTIFGIKLNQIYAHMQPARTIAAACAGILLAAFLLQIPKSAHQYFTAQFGGGVQQELGATSKADDPSSSSTLLQLNEEHRNEWLSRKVSRNTIWPKIDSRDNGNGTILYRVKLSLNEKALFGNTTTARIGAKVYLLPPNQFNIVTENVEPEWEGSILKGAPVVIPVVVDQSQGNSGSVNLLVTWKFRQRDFAMIVYLPARSQGSYGNSFGLSMNNTNLSDRNTGLYYTLETISRKHCVPVIANANLKKTTSIVNFDDDTLDDVLRKTLNPLGFDWAYLEGSVHVDRRLIVNQDDN